VIIIEQLLTKQFSVNRVEESEPPCNVVLMNITDYA